MNIERAAENRAGRESGNVGQAGKGRRTCVQRIATTVHEHPSGPWTVGGFGDAGEDVQRGGDFRLLPSARRDHGVISTDQEVLYFCRMKTMTGPACA